MKSHRSTQMARQATVYICVWPAPHQLRASLFVLSRYLGTSSDFLKAGSTELKFVLVRLDLATSEWWQANKGFCVAVSCATKATQTRR